MARILDKSKVHAGPKSWRNDALGVRITWEPSREHFDSFYGRIVQFTQANKVPTPSEAEVEGQICAQMPAGWCSNGAVQAVTRAIPRDQVVSGCRTCGGRR